MDEWRVALGIFIGVVAALLGISLWLAPLIGAAVAPTFATCVKTILALAIILAVRWWLTQELSVTIGIAVLCLAVIFPLWWPVLDSIALGGNSDLGGVNSDLGGVNELRITAPWNDSWINSGWLKWGVEAVLVALTGIIGYREIYD